MSEPDYTLSFAIDENGDQVFVQADDAGLEFLIKSLARLRQKLSENICDHDHLFTDAWAGNELTQQTLSEGTRTVHHVKIYGWTKEWVLKNGLKN